MRHLVIVGEGSEWGIIRIQGATPAAAAAVDDDSNRRLSIHRFPIPVLCTGTSNLSRTVRIDSELFRFSTNHGLIMIMLHTMTMADGKDRKE